MTHQIFEEYHQLEQDHKNNEVPENSKQQKIMSKDEE